MLFTSLLLFAINDYNISLKFLDITRPAIIIILVRKVAENTGLIPVINIQFSEIEVSGTELSIRNIYFPDMSWSYPRGFKHH
jgi:hypothetical protein